MTLATTNLTARACHAVNAVGLRLLRGCHQLRVQRLAVRREDSFTQGTCGN